MWKPRSHESHKRRSRSDVLSIARDSDCAGAEQGWGVFDDSWHKQHRLQSTHSQRSRRMRATRSSGIFRQDGWPDEWSGKKGRWRNEEPHWFTGDSEIGLREEKIGTHFRRLAIYITANCCAQSYLWFQISGQKNQGFYLSIIRQYETLQERNGH